MNNRENFKEQCLQSPSCIVQKLFSVIPNIHHGFGFTDSRVQELKKRWQGERQEFLKFPCFLKKNPATNVKGKQASEVSYF
jgi:hypothetical protein